MEGDDMSDTLTPEQRSWNMSRIRGKDTSIEMKVRLWLFRHGYRYRKNVKKLPGKPDIVLRPYDSVIFVHGCFWHRHAGCKNATIPKTRTDFWQSKFKHNVASDQKNKSELEKMGFRVIVLWECDIQKNMDEEMKQVVRIIGPPRIKR